MTEIPEHLLKRAAQARAKSAGETPPADASPAVSADAAPAAVPKAAAPVKAPPVVKPAKIDPPYVQAAKRRRKMPFWAMGALSIMPVWAFMYVRGMQPDIKRATGPLVEGTADYSKFGCVSCHGAAGAGSDAGGVGRPLYQGEVLKTFPSIEDMINFVYVGSQNGYRGVQYGDPNREGGAHVGAQGQYSTGMPQQGAAAGGPMTDAQILAVVCHVRYDIAGAEPDSTEYVDEYEKWCAPEAEKWLAAEEGATFDNAEEFPDVGVEQRPSVLG